MLAIRPRDTRLPMDTVRTELKNNPYVFKVTERNDKDMQISVFKVERVDVEFANNFFYWNDVESLPKTTSRLLMCPLKLAGDE